MKWGYCLILISLALVEAKPQSKVKLMALPTDLVIAHRGTTFWAPEETEAAMRWARNMGADYLEFDLQRTKDGYLIALHDDKLLRTTDVAIKFPDRQDQPVSSFTYEELLQLDAGTWFNLANPERSRASFVGLDILTLEDVVQIAEGKRIKRDAQGKRIVHKNKTGNWITEYEPDPANNGNRPGIYVETKVPSLFPGIEQDLKAELIRLAWYHGSVAKLKPIKTQAGKVQVANSPQRVVLQTFSKKSLATLLTTFKRPLPTCFLLWHGQDPDDLPDTTATSLAKWMRYGVQHGATIIGPSIAGAPNDYDEILTPTCYQLAQKYKLQIHAYSFDTEAQWVHYHPWVQGVFTNKADEALAFYRAKKNWLPNPDSATDVLKQLGY